MHFPGFLNDIIFKCVFGRHEAEPVLLALLNALLARTGDERLVGLKLENPNLDREHRKDKAPVLDLVAVDDQLRRYNIEVQVAEQARFRSRSVYYVAKTHGSQLESGEKYHVVAPTIGVCLLGYVLFPERERLHSVYALRELHDGDVLVPDLEMHYIEVAKFHEVDPRRLSTPAEKWLHVLKYLEPGVGDLPPELRAEEGVEMAIERAREAMSDKEVRHQLEMRRKAERDQATRVYEAELQGLARGHAEGVAEGLAVGREEGLAVGREEGHQEGRVEGHLDVARAMLDAGMELGTISLLTKVPVEELERLAPPAS